MKRNIESNLVKLSVCICPLLLLVVSACNNSNGMTRDSQSENLPYRDVTSSNLPVTDLEGLSMDAAVSDLDQDGDPDIVIANEFGRNILLLNDGTGMFTNASSRFPDSTRDSEDIGIADFDGDGNPDIVIVSEDDEVNELYFNQGNGEFSDESSRIQVDGVSNAVEVFDINLDGLPDILIGNNGQNVILINDGDGGFRDETGNRLPLIEDITQDVEIGDIDNDGHPDILVGNEDANRILINNGSGEFEDQSDSRLPLRDTEEETREAKLGDIDGDGDLDIFFANIRGFNPDAVRQNRLLVNDGSGIFTDVTATQLPEDEDRSFTALFTDVDRDGDLDIITGNVNGNNFGGNTPYRVYLNDGNGNFTEETSSIFPESVSGRGFDIVEADFNGDGIQDYFFASRGSVDQLLFGQ